MENQSLPHHPHLRDSDDSEADNLFVEAGHVERQCSTDTGESPNISPSSSVSRHQQRNLAAAPSGEEDIHSGGQEEGSTLLSDDHRRTSLSDNESEHCQLPAFSNAEKIEPTPSVLLHKSSYIFFMVLAYSTLALTAWILTCLLTHNPLTASQYQFNVNDHSYGSTAKVYHAKYAKSEEVYRAARTLQAIVAVLTIPLTSAVCSAAAVVFSQAGSKEHRLTMRQMMALADKGWSDPATILKLVFGNRRRYVSRLLIFAVLINFLGRFASDPL